MMPLVIENDEGIRPAGKPDECFYCQQKIGQPHAADCVMAVVKRIKARYIFEIELDAPHHWTKRDFEFHRNQSSWCASNALAELETIENQNGCLCSVFQAEFIEVIDDTPRRG